MLWVSREIVGVAFVFSVCTSMSGFGFVLCRGCFPRLVFAIFTCLLPSDVAPPSFRPLAAPIYAGRQGRGKRGADGGASSNKQ